MRSVVSWLDHGVFPAKTHTHTHTHMKECLLSPSPFVVEEMLIKLYQLAANNVCQLYVRNAGRHVIAVISFNTALEEMSLLVHSRQRDSLCCVM